MKVQRGRPMPRAGPQNVGMKPGVEMGVTGSCGGDRKNHHPSSQQASLNQPPFPASRFPNATTAETQWELLACWEAPGPARAVLRIGVEDGLRWGSGQQSQESGEGGARGGLGSGDFQPAMSGKPLIQHPELEYTWGGELTPTLTAACSSQ